MSAELEKLAKEIADECKAIERQGRALLTRAHDVLDNARTIVRAVQRVQATAAPLGRVSTPCLSIPSPLAELEQALQGILQKLVDPIGIKPTTSSLRTKRSIN